MSIYSSTIITEFKPTWLYIKTHTITGKKYFGKTSQKNPCTYKGSGTYWRNHLKIHGNTIHTELIGPFYSIEDIQLYALMFLLTNNIVKSKEWANEKPENGLDGGNNHNPTNKGKPLSISTKQRLSEVNMGKKMSVESSIKKSQSLSGRIFTEEHKAKLGKAKPPRTAEHSANISAAKKGKTQSASLK